MSRERQSECGKGFNSTYNRLGSDNERILWHVAGAVNLAVVVDSLDDFNLSLVAGLEAAGLLCEQKKWSGDELRTNYTTRDCRIK